jgi:hypothetical protein
MVLAIWSNKDVDDTQNVGRDESSVRSVALASQDGWELRSACRFCDAVGALATKYGAIGCNHCFVLLGLT